MDFSFNEEQKELRRSARRFLESASSTEQVLTVMETAHGYDSDVWRRIGEELGWPALTIPEEFDGMGMSSLDLHPLMEEMGRAALCSPFFSTVCMAANALLVAGTNEQKKEHLPSIADGTMTAALAYAERSSSHGPAQIEATFKRDGSDFILHGTKSYVVDGHTADLLIIAAREEGSVGNEGISLFVVSGSAKGVQRKWLPTMDQSRKLAEITLDAVRVPSSSLMGDEGQAAPLLRHALDLATTALCAEQVGGAERCLEMSVEYAKVRTQFGRPIGSFQAIKHKCADMLLRVESARSAAFYASAVAGEGSNELAEAASSAKAYCSDAYFYCAAENIQIHGGIGFTWEHPAHLYFKRAKSSEVLLGSPVIHRERVAQLMEM